MASGIRRHLALTDIQAKVDRFVRRFAHAKAYMPSIKEIADKLELSPGTVQGALTALERKGKLRRVPNVARGLVLVEQ